MTNNKQAWKVFIIVVIYTILCVISLDFKKDRASYNLDILASYRGYRSSVECALNFGQERTRRTKGVAFYFERVSHTCVIYNVTFGEHTNLTDHPVYIYQQHCDTSDGFQEIWMDNQMFCYALKKNKKSYLDASIHCSSLGGYLLNFDTSMELKAIESLHYKASTWVGANDIDTEGRWITDKDGTPISESWIWLPGQPNNRLGNQHCAVNNMEHGTFGVHDLSCSYILAYICERTT